MFPKPPADAPLSICIGQIVHYRSDGRCLAGTVIDFLAGPTSVALYVIDPAKGPFYAYPSYSADHVDGSWHWLGVGETTPHPWKALKL